MGFRSFEKQKMNYRKGLWSPDEDQRLRDYILKHGISCWSAIPGKAGLQRNGKSCRLRWINYLRPGLKRGVFSIEEEETVVKLQAQMGNKWSQIAVHLPGRTDNEIKNYWNSYLKKKVQKVQGSFSPKSETSTLVSNSETLVKLDETKSQIIPTTERAEQLESHLSDTSQLMSSSSQVSFTGVTGTERFPKVLFEDWLSFDERIGHNMLYVDDLLSNTRNCKNSYASDLGNPESSNIDGFNTENCIGHSTTNLNESVEKTKNSASSYIKELEKPELLQNDNTLNCQMYEGYEVNSCYGVSQAQTGLMCQIPQTGFFDISPTGDVFSSLDGNHDFSFYL